MLDGLLLERASGGDRPIEHAIDALFSAHQVEPLF